MASTNNIVKTAGIGKGTLFYYFHNKLELYNYLMDYSLAFISELFTKVETQNNCDFIEKYQLISKYKMEAYIKCPQVFEFLTSLYFNEDELNIHAETKKRYSKLMETRHQLLQNVYTCTDMSMFRDDIDVERSIKYIRWCMDGYIQEITAVVKEKKFSDIDVKYWEDFDEYLNDLKLLFYK